MKNFILTVFFSLFMFTSNAADIDTTIYEVVFDDIYVTTYYADGTKLSGRINYDNERIGTWHAYHANGKLATIMRYNSYGVKDGSWYSYTDDGQLIYSVSYDNGLRVGTWKMYNRGGELIQVYFYDSEGNKIETICATN